MPLNTSRGYTYPVYTDAANFPAQIQDLAQDIDTDMDSLFDRVTAGYNMAAVHLNASLVNQAVPANTDTAATFTTELYDNTGMANLGVSTTTVTFTQTGLYLATCRATFLSNGNVTVNARQISLNTTGSLGIVGRKSVRGHLSVATAVQLTVLFFASAGDTCQMIQRQNSGASVNTSTRTLQIARMGAL
jgi:hypothetical protein